MANPSTARAELISRFRSTDSQNVALNRRNATGEGREIVMVQERLNHGDDAWYALALGRRTMIPGCRVDRNVGECIDSHSPKVCREGPRHHDRVLRTFEIANGVRSGCRREVASALD